MNKPTLAAATVLIVIAVGAVTIFRAAGRPDLRGHWITEACERVPLLSSDGTAPYYTKRDYLFTDATWRLTADAFRDAECTQKFVTVEAGGEYESGDKSVSMKLASYKLTPHSSEFASVLEQNNCGTEPWVAGKSQDIQSTGCLRYYFPGTKCSTFHETAKREGDILFFGSRSLIDFCERSNFTENDPDHPDQLKKSQ